MQPTCAPILLQLLASRIFRALLLFIFVSARLAFELLTSQFPSIVRRNGFVDIALVSTSSCAADIAVSDDTGSYLLLPKNECSCR